MSRWAAITLALAAAVRAGETPRPADDEELRLIQVLNGAAGVTEKDAACIRLQRIGTERAVPALAALLSHPGLSHPARYALETLPSPSAGWALVTALELTSGSEQIGIVGSLAVRREEAAVPALARLLAAPPGGPEGGREELATALAAALGTMESSGALAALEAAWIEAAPPRRPALADALLAHAGRLLARGLREDAARLFGAVFRRETRPSLRVAAYQGVIRAAGAEALTVFVAALAGPPAPEQAAALGLLPDWPLEGARAALMPLLPTLPPAVQVAALGGWLQRVDPPDRNAVAPLLASVSPEVRVTAVRALGRVGDERDVPPLVELAAAGGATQAAARSSLVEMQPSAVGDCLREMLRSGREEVRVEAARALGQRGDSRAMPELLALADGSSGDLRLAAWRALSLMAPESGIEGLIKAVIDARESTGRNEGARAIALALDRLQPPEGAASLRALLRAIGNASEAVRIALLPACSVLASADVRAAVRVAMGDASPAVRAAAIRAAASSVDPQLVPDLLRLAIDPGADEFRDLATRACVRLVTRDGARRSAEDRLRLFRSLAAAPLSTAQKRTLLAGLAAGQTVVEIELAERFLADAEVWPEAVAAVTGVAGRLPAADETTELLRLLLGCALDVELRRAVESALRAVEARVVRPGRRG